MKCPYCQDKIDEHALVCKSCGRDLLFFKPVLNRILEWENHVRDIEARLAILENSSHIEAPTSRPRHGAFPVRSQVPVGVSAIVTGVFLVLLSLAGICSKWNHTLLVVLLGASVAYPLVGGFIAGMVWPCRHTGAYFVWGLLSGGVTSSTFLFGLEVIRQVRHVGENMSAGAMGYFLIVLASGLLFATGGLVGDWLQALRHPEAIQIGFPERIAAFTMRRGVSEVAASDQGVKTVAAFFSALAPILTFIASIAASYLAYLATLVKK